jgi:predicted pyridoxine 5'-phosphate oxidase superfamily flavin-nucleotide-binding protein
MNYGQLAFTDAIKKMQEEAGSRSAYDRMEKMSVVDGLTDNEIKFIEERDSFYMASFGENEYPYVQHRGGPAGFIKVIDNKTIGIVDFSGNRQYISTGNISKNEKVALIMVSYPQRARLKLYANAKIVGLEENNVLYALLEPKEYKFRPERMMVFEIQAYDWNCPQHITPRYTAEEIEQVLLPQKKYISDLENKVKELELKLSEI